MIFPVFLHQAQAQAYDLLLKSLYSHTVPVIYPEKLQEKIAAGNKIYLLDTRTEKEFAVSHLQGAVFVNFDRFQEKQLKNIPKNATVVVYCTVGYRSEKIGEKLLTAGYTNVLNLYGGIFEWVNSGRAVVNADGPTNHVHAYSKTWGVWLKKGEKVYD